MTDETPAAAEGEPAAPGQRDKRGRRAPRTVLRWVGGAVLGLAALVALLLIGLNSDAGRRFIITQIEKYAFENGMKIGIGRLDGSIYGAMVVRDFTLSDPQGVFLAAPEVRVDWRPFAYLWNHVDVRSATARTMTLQRLPEFKPVPDTDEPLLPDIDIDVGTVRVDRFVFAPAVAGERQEARIAGRIAIADRRAQVSAEAETIGANGARNLGGDRLKLLLDAVPEANRLAMTLDVSAPKGGVIAAMGGFEEPLTAKLDGRGDWKAWNGALTASLGTAPLANIALTARDGSFTAKGMAQPARLLAESAAALFAPQTDIDVTARLAERKAAIDGRLSSEAMRLGISGGPWAAIATTICGWLSSCCAPQRSRPRCAATVSARRRGSTARSRCRPSNIRPMPGRSPSTTSWSRRSACRARRASMPIRSRSPWRAARRASADSTRWRGARSLPCGSTAISPIAMDASCRTICACVRRASMPRRSSSPT